MPEEPAAQPAEQSVAAPDLALQYGDNDESAVSAPAEPAAPTTPARDPETGRFLPSSSAESSDEPAPSPVSPHLLKIAEDFGIPSDGLSEGALAAAVRAVTRRHADLLGSAERARTPSDEAPPPPRQPAEDDPLASFTEDRWDPEFVRPVKAAFQKLQSRLDALEGQLRLERDNRAGESNTAKLDRGFAALSDPRLGSSAREELDDDDPVVSRRSAVVAQAVKMAGPKATIAQVCAKLKAARDVLYDVPAEKPKKGDAPVQRTEDRATSQWADAALRRPTHRSGATEPDGYQKAVNSVAEMQRDMRRSQGSPALDEEFPE